MESGEKKVDEVKSEPQNKVQQLEDRQAILNLVTRQADENAKTAFERKLAQEKEKFELINGKVTSVYEERESLKNILAELPQNYDPKFIEFFPAFGRLMGWSEDVLRAYHKPPVVAKTINEVIYDRFPKEVIIHIHSKNPYIKWCIRKHKNYKFLGEDGIFLLEQFIDDAVTLMQECTSLYEFRVKHAAKFGSSFQLDLFKQKQQAI